MASSRHNKSTEIVRFQLRYKINEDGVTATVLGIVDRDYKGELKIAEKIYHDGNFYKVTHIENNAFDYCVGLTGSLTLPKSLLSIGENAFCGCSGLTGALTIPDGITNIEISVFKDCAGLTGPLTIPEGVTVIKSGAFSGCSGLKGPLSLPKSLVAIGMYAFCGCSGLTGALTLPKSLVTIGGDAFNGCSNITQLIIAPGGEPHIAYSRDDRLMDKEILNTLRPYSTCVHNADFQDTRADECGVKFSRDRKRLFKAPQGLTSYIIPQGTEVICYEAFARCGVKEVVVPTSVTIIKDRAFARCEQLEHIEIPNQAIEMGDAIFLGCTKLTNVTLPESLTRINDYMFCYCESLATIKLPPHLREIGICAFYGCLSLKNFSIPQSIRHIEILSFAFCESITSLTVPKPTGTSPMVVGIGNMTFYGCKNIAYIYLPQEMYSLAYEEYSAREVFGKCDSLKAIYVPQGSREKIVSILGKDFDKYIVEVPEQEQHQEASLQEDTSRQSPQNVEHDEPSMVVDKSSIAGNLLFFFKFLIKKK